MPILFFEEEHKYVVTEKPDLKLTSVSSVVHSVVPSFDRETISRNYAKKHKRTQEDVLEEWDAKNKRALTRGSLFHAEEEQRTLKGGGISGYNAIDSNTKEALNLRNLSPGVYTELIIPYLPAALIGTADKITIHPDRSFSILDYKTNEKLSFEATAYWKPALKRKEKGFLLTPVSHLEDCNGVHYLLQLSLYSLFLEKYGYKFRDGIIEHIIFDDYSTITPKMINRVQYPLVFLKKEAEALITHYQRK